MPYVSESQRKYFNANRKRLEAQGVDVDEWNDASRGLKLPKRVKKMSVAQKAAAMRWALQKVAKGGTSAGDRQSDFAESLRNRKLDRLNALPEEATQPAAASAPTSGVPATIKRPSAPQTAVDMPNGLDAFQPAPLDMPNGPDAFQPTVPDPRADPTPVPLYDPKQLALIGALLGGGTGALRGVLSGEEDEEGRKRNRLRWMLQNTLGGAAIGGGLGAGAAYGLNNSSQISELGRAAAKRVGV